MRSVWNGGESVVRKAGSWKGAAVQRGNRRITIFGAVIRQLLVKTLRLENTCKMWKSVMAL
jgi:hypothetical protein